MSDEKQTIGQRPGWYERMSGLFRDMVSHSFIVHGNLHDYVELQGGGQYTLMRNFLTANLERHADVVVQLSPSRGMEIISYEQRKLFSQLIDKVPRPGAAPAPAGAVPNIMGPTKKASAEDQPELPKLSTDILQATKDLDVAFSAPWSGLLTPKYPGDEEHKPRIALILDYGELIMPNSDPAQTNTVLLARLLDWARNLTYDGRRHILIMLTTAPEALHPDLLRVSGRWEQIEIPMPDPEMRHRFITWQLDEFANGDEPLDLDLVDITAREIAQLTGALRLWDIQDMLMRGVGQGALDRQVVVERKRTIIDAEYRSVIEVKEPGYGFERIGGGDYLKDWFRESVVKPWRAGRLSIGGILMSGPPGTGKSYMAEALAYEAGVNFVRYNPAKILGKYVGESERNQAKAEQAIMALAPVVVFMDELDQSVQRGEGESSGVDNRVFGAILQFMERPDRRGKVLFVAATNRPDLLDAALVSRFDTNVPLLPAPSGDRQAVIMAQLAMQARARTTVDAGVLVKATEATEGWTNRHIRDWMARVVEYIDAGKSVDDAIPEALAIYRPKLREVQRQTLLALAEVTDLRLLPPEYRNRTAAAEAQVEEEDRVEDRRTSRRGRGAGI